MTEETTTPVQPLTTTGLPIYPGPPLQRNEFGLIQGLEYKFENLGWVDWRAMLNPEFLYPNKDAFKGVDVPESIEGLEDHQLLCKLGGYKDLARIRGYKKVSYELIHLTNGVAAICTIEWIGNYETSGEAVVFSSTANATIENTSGFGAKFFETIAENRAFVRAVRNFLNIHIVGADEIDKSKNTGSETPEPAKVTNELPTTQKALYNRLIKAGCNKTNWLAKIKELSGTGSFEFDESWKRTDDIPTITARKIMGLLDKETK